MNGLQQEELFHFYIFPFNSLFLSLFMFSETEKNVARNRKLEVLKSSVANTVRVRKYDLRNDQVEERERERDE